MSAETFAVGDRCEANYQGLGVWYSGRIAAVSSSPASATVGASARRPRPGTLFDIRYDDGDVEMEVRRSLLRAPLMPGDLCEGNFQAHGIWYPGTVSVVRDDD